METLLSSIAQCRPALGTYVKIALEGEMDENALLSHSVGAFAEIQRIEGLMSFHDRESELSRINREAHLRPVPVSPEMERVLGLALRLSAETDGAFDLTVASALVRRGALPDHGGPSGAGNWRDVHLEGGRVHFCRPLRLDLGGIAKGFAVDCALSLLPEELAVVVDAGGDLRMRPWRGRKVGVRLPGAHGGHSLLDAPMLAEAVATSAAYFHEDAHPVMDPKTHAPIRDARSVSVFAPTCMLADALTKVVFLHSESESLLRHLEAVALVVDEDGRMSWIGDF